MAKCPECRGKGKIDCPLEYGEDKHPSECPACHGTNKATCPECGGTGKIDSED